MFVVFSLDDLNGQEKLAKLPLLLEVPTKLVWAGPALALAMEIPPVVAR
jgi:hypothetical protein